MPMTLNLSMIDARSVIGLARTKMKRSWQRTLRRKLRWWMRETVPRTRRRKGTK